MCIITASKLFKISFNVQGWTGIADLNFRRLNSELLFVSAIGNVNLSRALEERDLLVWDTATQKWILKRWGEYFVTTTSTTTTSSSSTTTTTTGA